MVLEELLPFLKKPALEAKGACRPPKAQEPDFYRVRSEVYRKIIEKYADHIGRQEEKTVPELKMLVNGKDGAIAKLAREIERDVEKRKEKDAPGAEDEELKYDFSKDFLEAAQKAFEIVKSLQAINADLTISYWLSPKEVLELKAADPFDKAIFLCSLFHALGEKSAKIRVVEIEGGTKHPLVLFEREGKKFVLDASDEGCRFNEAWTEATHDELVKTITCSGKKITRQMYEFNDQEYAQL